MNLGKQQLGRSKMKLPVVAADESDLIEQALDEALYLFSRISPDTATKLYNS